MIGAPTLRAYWEPVAFRGGDWRMTGDERLERFYLANRIASRAAEHEEWVKKHDKWKEQCWQATLIYSRAIKDMRALGLDKPAVVAPAARRNRGLGGK